MRLRIPCRQVQYKLTALRFWFLEIRIMLRERSKQLPPGAFEVQTKCRVECMAGFVAKNAHTLGISAALHLQHLLALKLHQTRMSEIKGNRNARDAVRREPFFGQPNMRLKPNATLVEFAVEPFDMWLEERALDLEGQIADAQIEQVLVS